MPEIGEVTRADEIGRAGKGKKHVWVFCPICKEERWVHKTSTLSNTSRFCRACNIRVNARFHL